VPDPANLSLLVPPGGQTPVGVELDPGSLVTVADNDGRTAITEDPRIWVLGGEGELGRQSRLLVNWAWYVGEVWMHE
jgi:hypothetical protein